MRQTSVDLLRAVAIFLMVLVHFVENLSGVGKYAWLPAGFAAPMFAMLSGVSYRFWTAGLERRGVSDTEITKRSIRRGLFLLGVGFAFNVLVWMPEDTYNWDVLTYIGAALIALTLSRRLPEPILLAAGATVFVLSPVSRYVANYSSYWQLAYFDPDLTLSDVTLGFFVTGYFPLFPWILYPFAGFLAAPRIFARPGDTAPPDRSSIWKWGGALVAVAVVVRGSGDWAPEHLRTAGFQGWTMFPPSIAYVAGSLGIALLAIAATYRWADERGGLNPEGRLATLARTFSAHSLSMYVLHHVAHLWPLWLYSAAAGHEPTHYWQLALPAYASVIAGLVFVVGAYFLFRWMDRRQIKGIEGLMRWVCD